MQKIALTTLIFLFVLVLGHDSFGQSVYSGKVTDLETGDPLIGVNVLVKGTVTGTITDYNGDFNLQLKMSPPFTLVFTSVGYESKEVNVVSDSHTQLDVQLREGVLLGQEVVVSASRVEEKVFTSPVSVERMDILDVANSPSTSFYDALKNLNGIDFSSQSLTFKTVNSRGFGSNGNTRFVQMIDGIDNQAPGLNFAVGNIVGIGELDLESAEFLPGASSALYGPNALQGILLMKSKSPFEYQGLSAYTKIGVNHVDGIDDDPSLYQDYGIRYAKAFKNKLAFKITASYLKANDFRATDYRDQSDIVERSENNDPTDRALNRTYDGVNVYGEPLLNVGQLGVGSGADNLMPTDERGNFTPTGYTESELLSNETKSFKVGAALHYRINSKLELLGQYNIGYGSTVYTANDRFVLDGFNIATAKLELRGSNFYVRAYTTQEDAGDSYAANTLASLINVNTTIPNYVGTFAGARMSGANIEQAHLAARASSDQLRAENIANGRFNVLYDSLRAIPISGGGAKFLDKSDLYHAEASYNFQNLTFADVVVGGNYRQYALNSQGTLFALQDNGDEVSYEEFGMYVQGKKTVLDDKLDIQASVRYDKNENFKGQFSPKFSAVIKPTFNHNFRLSFQRGFRIPTSQDQFIDLDVVSRRLIGSNEFLKDRYKFMTNTVYTTQSYLTAQASGNVDDLVVETRVGNEFKTEKVNTLEGGYRGLFLDGKLIVDGYYYYNIYHDMIAEIDFIQGVPDGLRVQPSSEVTREEIVNGSVPIQRYGVDVNAEGDVKSHGWGVKASYSLSGGYILSGNVSYNKLISQQDLLEEGFKVDYNTPEYRYNLSVSNRNVWNDVGFKTSWRWQDAFLWDSPIGTGVIPAFGTLDAQVTYKMKPLKTIVKLGGSNILNKRYTTSFANPTMGAIYYVQLTFDQFLN